MTDIEAAEDIFGSSTSKPITQASTQARRHEAVVAHAHALGLLGPHFALQFLIRGLQSLVLLRDIIHALLEPFYCKLHLIQLKSLLLDGSLVLLDDHLVGLRLQSRSFILVLRCGQFRLESPLLVLEVIQLLRHGNLLRMHPLCKLKHILASPVSILVLLLEALQTFSQGQHI